MCIRPSKSLADILPAVWGNVFTSPKFRGREIGGSNVVVFFHENFVLYNID